MQPDMQNSEATALDEQVQAEETISSKDEFALDIKYNGESMSLDREKAIEMAQKGMNYDHVFEELKSLGIIRIFLSWKSCRAGPIWEPASF